jgi:hypothetical protein
MQAADQAWKESDSRKEEQDLLDMAVSDQRRADAARRGGRKRLAEILDRLAKGSRTRAAEAAQRAEEHARRREELERRW